MASQTAYYDLPYPVDSDPVRDGNEAIQALAERLDYLLGECGDFTSAAASGTSTQTVNLTRAYPGGFKVLVSFRTTTGGDAAECWGLQLSTAGGPGGVAQATIGVNNTTGSTARSGSYFIKPLPV